MIARKIPIIDCSAIANEKFEDIPVEAFNKVAQEIGAAMTGIGMCNLINHGISKEKIEKVHAVSKRFFDLPTQTKLKYRKISPRKSFHGYAAPGDELLNEEGKNSTELREFFDIWGTDSRNEKLYPNDEIPNFKAVYDDVRRELEDAGKKILRCIEIHLQLEKGTLLSKHTNLGDDTVKTHSQMRSLHYYAIDTNNSFRTDVTRCGEHSDWGTITLVIQDMIGGLEIKTSDGEWIAANPIQDAILLNSGQLLEYWTGGRFHAAPHRVRIIIDGGAQKAGRQSFVYFINPDGNAEVYPIIPVLAEKKEHFKKYNNKPIVAYDHYQKHIEKATKY